MKLLECPQNDKQIYAAVAAELAASFAAWDTAMAAGDLQAAGDVAAAAINLWDTAAAAAAVTAFDARA